jgi:nitrous oxide reductase accessory protein NosL
MNRKIVIGIVVAAIFVASMFAGCVEEENEPTATPTPTITSAPTPILVS